MISPFLLEQGWCPANETTRDIFNPWGQHPFDALIERRVGGTDGLAAYDFVVLAAHDGTYIPVHGTVKMTAEDSLEKAVKALDRFYADLPEGHRFTAEKMESLWKGRPAWAVRPDRYLGLIDRTDPSSANWDEQGFLSSRPRFRPDGEVIHRSPPFKLAYIAGEPNQDSRVSSRDLYRLGRGVEKDEGRWFLLAETHHSDGRVDAPRAVGEYASGSGICQAHRGHGAGKAFFKALMERGIWVREGLGFSPAGLAAARSAHRELVAEAIFNGCAVPEDVLAAYPGVVPEQRESQHSP